MPYTHKQPMHRTLTNRRLFYCLYGKENLNVGHDRHVNDTILPFQYDVCHIVVDKHCQNDPDLTSQCSVALAFNMYTFKCMLSVLKVLVCHLSLPLMNSFNKTEAAFSQCRLCILRASLFSV